ncbi:OmpA family protein [Acidobacteriota bacterium]
MGNKTPLFIGGAAVVVIIAIIVGWLALRGGDETDGADTTEVVTQETPPPITTTTDVKPDRDYLKPDLRTPYFDFDKSYIRTDAADALRYNLNWLRENADVQIVLEGHCDRWGGKEYNLALGQKRAQSVRNWLGKNTGVNPSRFSTVSYGQERLVDFGQTEEADQRNRRVEFKVISP